MNNLQSAKVLAPVALVVVVADQVAKQWAVDNLTDGPIDVLGSARFVLGFNTGMAFSQGQSLGPLIGVVALVVIGVLVASVAKSGTLLTRTAAGLVVGGAAGNVIDRLFRQPGWFRGAVVDFIEVFAWFPIFNIADICITVGGGLMILSAWLANRKQSLRPDAV